MQENAFSKIKFYSQNSFSNAYMYDMQPFPNIVFKTLYRPGRRGIGQLAILHTGWDMVMDSTEFRYPITRQNDLKHAVLSKTSMNNMSSGQHVLGDKISEGQSVPSNKTSSGSRSPWDKMFLGQNILGTNVLRTKPFREKTSLCDI